MAEFVFLYVTCKDEEEAGKIGEKLVEEKLAACCNIIPEVVSFFFWKGEKKRERESVLIVKTRQKVVDEVVKRVKELHSYSVPEVLVLPVVSGNEDYLKWAEESVK